MTKNYKQKAPTWPYERLSGDNMQVHGQQQTANSQKTATHKKYSQTAISNQQPATDNQEAKNNWKPSNMESNCNERLSGDNMQIEAKTKAKEK